MSDILLTCLDPGKFLEKRKFVKKVQFFAQKLLYIYIDIYIYLFTQRNFSQFTLFGSALVKKFHSSQ